MFDSKADTAVFMMRKSPYKEGSILNQTFTVREVRASDAVRFKEAEVFTRTYSCSSINIRQHQFNEFILSPFVDLWSRLAHACPSLGSVAEVGTGIRLRSDDTTSVSSRRTVTHNKPFVDRLNVLVPFALLTSIAEDRRKWLHRGPHLDRARPENQVLFDSEKVLVNSNRTPSSSWRLVAAIGPAGLYFSHNFHGLVPKGDDTTVEQIVAVLNSPVANAWFDAHCKKRWVVVRTLEQMPFPKFDPDAGDRLATAVRRLEKAIGTKWKRATEGLFYDEIEKEDANVADLQAAVDRMVYDAYGLSDMERLNIDRSMSRERRPM
jgi:hypothetical protein